VAGRGTSRVVSSSFFREPWHVALGIRIYPATHKNQIRYLMELPGIGSE
jgi:hypothetical protein